MKIIKNFLYNLSYQVFTLIVPLITIPYISRVLGPHGVGINSFTTSVSQYFVLIATLGLTTYGQREIAYKREHKEQVSKVFWEIELLSLISSLFSLIIFIFFIFFITKKYEFYYLLQLVLVLSCAADISWFFNGLEMFKVTVLRNFLFKLISVLAIFIFVKKPSDIGIYILIISFSTFLGNISLWSYLRKYLVKVKVKSLNIKVHVKPTLLLFIPQVAINIYVFLNKIMLGSISSVEQAGFFDSSDKIIRMCLTLITALTTVMMPRVASLFAKGDQEGVKKYLKNGFGIALMLSFPLFFGIEGIASSFIPWFFGAQFYAVVNIIIVEAFAIIPISISQILGMQYLVPLGKTKLYSKAIICGAIINFGLNVPLIYYYSAVGTAVATVISEVFITMLELFYVSRDLNVKLLFFETWKPFLASFIMFFTILYLNSNIGVGFLCFFLDVVIGGFIYVLLLYVFKYKLFLSIAKKIFKK